MKGNIVLLDGASGTRLWEKAEALGLPKNAVWTYNLDNPGIVTELAREYIDAGSQIILSNTFSANRPTVKRARGYDLQKVVAAGVRLAKEASGERAKVALSIGPLPTMLDPYGDMEEDECEEIYEEQIGAGMSEKPDLILLETFMDVEMMRVAATVARQYGVPVFCTMSFEKTGRTLMGNSVADVVDTLEPLGVDVLGLNCSLGPVQALPVIREFAQKTDLPLLLKPNAGMPVTGADGSTHFDFDAQTFAREMEPAVEYISYAGACCGSGPDFIRALKAIV